MIDPQNNWQVWALIVVGVAGCIALEQKFRWAAKISGPVLALLGGMFLSNLKVLPFEAPAYDVIEGYLVPLAIPLLLIRANVERIFKGTGKLFIAVNIAAIGTVIGAFFAAFLFNGKFPQVPEVTGTMTASYIGGGVNFMAVKNSYNLPSELSNPLLVADNFIMAGFFALLFLISTSKFFLKRYPLSQTESKEQDARALAAAYWKRKEISLSDLAFAVAFAILIAAVSMTATAWIKSQSSSNLTTAFFGNAYLLMTVLTVFCVTVFNKWTEQIRGADEVGGLFLYLFFFVIGLRADLIQVIKNVPVLFLFCSVMAVINLVFTLLVGKLLKIDLESLLLASNATLGGPTTAAAMAISKGWPALVLPAILAGLWGYIIGTFVGILCAEGVRALL